METSACAVVLFTLVVVVFRVCTHETLSVDEWTQFLGAFLFSSGMLLAEYNKNASVMSNIYANEALKFAILFALLVWTKSTQIHGPKVNLANTVDLNDKVVLITGGNSGIGLETARFCFNRGATVIVASRNIELASRAFAQELCGEHGKRLITMQLDLESFACVTEFTQEFCSRFPKLDILILNAGSLMLQRKITADGVECMMQINCFSPFLLALLLLKPLKRSSLKRGRIVAVTSSSCKLFTDLPTDLTSTHDFNLFKTYAKSKFAMNQLFFELERRINQHISVNVAHPGVIATDIVRNMHWFFRYGRHALFALYKTSTQGSNTQVYVSTNIAVENVSGKYFEHCASHPVAKLSDEQAREFFALAEVIVHTSFAKCWSGG